MRVGMPPRQSSAAGRVGQSENAARWTDVPDDDIVTGQERMLRVLWLAARADVCTCLQ